MKARSRPAAVRLGAEREVDPHVHAAVAEVPVGQALQAVLVQQRVEVAQVGAQLPGGTAASSQPARRAAVAVRAARPAPSSRIRQRPPPGPGR